jgi:hypothetical protein
MKRAPSLSPFVYPWNRAEWSALKSMVWLLVILAVQLISTARPVQAADDKVVMGPRVRVSPPFASNHSLMDLSIDPDHPDDLFVCGYRYSPPENAMLGFVYRSGDGGHSWREVVEDSSSAWVSEESCAAGGGRIFFMAERALLEHGKFASGLPLQEQGEIHLHSSSDGERWDSSVRRGWLDHTTMAVDWTHGPRRGRMYLFGQASRRRQSGYLDEIQLITSDDGKTLRSPVSVLLTNTSDYAAGYASSARVLPDGKVLAAYLVRRNARITDSKDGSQTYIEVFGTSDGGETLERRADFGPIRSCLGAMPAIDVNQADGTVYIVWGAMQHDGCELDVASSRDGGLTWSPPRGIVADGRVPSIAVNKRGMVGLLWLEPGESQCWKFAASSDHGRTFSNPVRISRCLASSATANLSQSARDASPEVHSPSESSSWKLETAAIGFSVIAAKDGLLPDRTGLATDPAGVFHAVWPEPTDQDGALWAASITVGTTNGVSMPENARDISNDVVLEFANAGFESESGVYALDVTVTNMSSQPMEGQILLRLDTAYSGYFKVVTSIGNDNEMSLERPLWVVWPENRAGALTPGQRSSPRRLSFLLKERYCSDPDFGDLLSVRLHAYSVP